MDSFKIIGIAIRTTNQNGQAAKDIPELWNRFLSSGVIEHIPNKLSSEIYSVYTDYEGDHMAPYTVILGCKVVDFSEVPEGMVAKEVVGGKYESFLAKGNLNEGAVFKAWSEIWKAPLDRAYTNDFEVYGEKAQNPENAEVEIFIAVK